MQTPRILCLASVAALMLCACLWPLAPSALAQEGPEEWEPGAPMGWNFKNLSPEQQQRMIRFSSFVNQRLPEEYLKAENSVGYTTKAIAVGGPLYAAHWRAAFPAIEDDSAPRASGPPPPAKTDEPSPDAKP